MICQRQAPQVPQPPQAPQPPQPPPIWLPPGNYNVTLCADGTVTIPCQQVGTFPIHDLAKFERAISGTLSKVLSSNGAGNCALGTWEVKAAADGVDVNSSATCTDHDGNTFSESVLIGIRP